MRKLASIANERGRYDKFISSNNYLSLCPVSFRIVLMKTLSIKQPWAFAILRKGKDIENRTWKTDLRGSIYIHAGKSFDDNAPEELRLAWADAVEAGDVAALVGGIVGTVEIMGCFTKYESPWWQGPFGFLLQNPITFPRFYPLKGQLRFFEAKYEPA